MLRSTTSQPAFLKENVKSHLSAESYLFFQRWIYNQSGVVIDEGKEYLLRSRLVPIVEKEKLRDLNELCRHLRNGTKDVAQQVLEAMMTHETFFFRDKSPFDAMRDVLVPRLKAARGRGHTLSIWSAAASSGQEAYSLAMLLLEMGLHASEFSILATDISEKVLLKAKEGVYGSFEVYRGLPEEYRARYFEQEGNGWKVSEALRNKVRFQRLDLRTQAFGIGPFDIVFCRNVLIYFDAATKEKILREIRRNLSPGGYLLLGASETIGQHAGWQRVPCRDTVAYMRS